MSTIHTFQINMPQLQNRERTIRIYLPPDYATSSKRYPVLYMQDGQNVFDASTSAYGTSWHVHETMNQRFARQEDEGWIVVGIDCGHGLTRYNEYSPWSSSVLREMKSDIEQDAGGEGALYAEFVATTLKSHIDGHYRTRPEREHTLIAGSSMGGMISMYTGLTYSHVYSGIGAFSTAVWFQTEAYYAFLEQQPHYKHMKIYTDIGTEETSNAELAAFPQIYVSGAEGQYARLKKAGYGEDQLAFVIEEGAPHNETAWAQRFPGALAWLLS
ncbi:alpha/beta hydrolase [Marinicrinis sediminis]|uniref:Alpha/beta hydrolase n=1 Tax=Marinicrinis sediminis TaxID=1652465 RepID=A0ABW5RCB7_9BACL